MAHEYDDLTPVRLRSSLEPHDANELGDLEALVAEAREGDPSALEALIVRFSPQLRRIIRARLGQRLREAGALDSMDLVQEALMVVQRRIQSFEYRGPGSVIAWLARIAENQIHDEFAKATARKRSDAHVVRICDLLMSGAFDPEHDGAQPDQEAAVEEERARVDRCVNELRPLYRETILMRCYAGADWATVAQGIDARSAAAARQTFGRAIAALEVALRGMER